MVRSIAPLLLAASLFASCATTPTTQDTAVVTVITEDAPGTAVPQADRSTLRSDSQLQKLHFGAYEDPANPDIRHDPHAVTRVVEHERWNLRNNKVEDVVTPNPNPPQTSVASALNDELKTKLEETQQLNKTLLRINQVTTHKLQTLKKGLATMQEMAKENAKLNRRVSELETKIQDEQEQQPAPQESLEDSSSIWDWFN